MTCATPEEVAGLLTTNRSDMIMEHAVSSRVNSVKNNGPELREKARDRQPLLMAQVLRREMGLGGAIVTGLGSILGTGAFVAIGVASGLWGDAVLMAIPVAGAVALFNGLSSAFSRRPISRGRRCLRIRVPHPWSILGIHGRLALPPGQDRIGSCRRPRCGGVPRRTVGSPDIGGRGRCCVDSARLGRSQANDHCQFGPRHQ